MTEIDQTEARLNSHEAVCAVRYEGIEVQMRGVNARLKRLEQVGISVAGAIIVLLVHLVTKGG
mgnify:CR=1 FL=1